MGIMEKEKKNGGGEDMPFEAKWKRGQMEVGIRPDWMQMVRIH